MEVHLITSWYSRRRPGKNATIKKVQLLKVIDNRVTPEIELRARNYPIDEETLRVARETPELVPQYIKDHPEKNLIFFGESSSQTQLGSTLDRILNHPETSNVLRNKESLTLKMNWCQSVDLHSKDTTITFSGFFAEGLYHYDVEVTDCNSNTKLFSIKDFTTKKGWDFGTFREETVSYSHKRAFHRVKFAKSLDNCKGPFKLKLVRGFLYFEDCLGSGLNLGSRFGSSIYQRNIQVVKNWDTALLTLLSLEIEGLRSNRSWHPVHNSGMSKHDNMYFQVIRVAKYLWDGVTSAKNLINEKYHSETSARSAIMLLELIVKFFDSIEPGKASKDAIDRVRKLLEEGTSVFPVIPASKMVKDAALDQQFRDLLPALEKNHAKMPKTKEKWLKTYNESQADLYGKEALEMQDLLKSLQNGLLWRLRHLDYQKMLLKAVENLLSDLTLQVFTISQRLLLPTPQATGNQQDLFRRAVFVASVAPKMMLVGEDFRLILYRQQTALGPDGTQGNGWTEVSSRRILGTCLFKMLRIGQFFIVYSCSLFALHILSMIQRQKLELSIIIKHLKNQFDWQTTVFPIAGNLGIFANHSPDQLLTSRSLILHKVANRKEKASIPSCFEEKVEIKLSTEMTMPGVDLSDTKFTSILLFPCASHLLLLLKQTAKTHLVALEVKRGADIKDTTLEFKGHTVAYSSSGNKSALLTGAGPEKVEPIMVRQELYIIIITSRQLSLTRLDRRLQTFVPMTLETRAARRFRDIAVQAPQNWRYPLNTASKSCCGRDQILIVNSSKMLNHGIRIARLTIG